MKKLFVLAIATLFAFSMSAQKFGVKAGMNMSGYIINFYAPDGSSMGLGFHAGLVGEMPINDMISLKGDLMFRQLGSDFDSKNNTDEDWPIRALGMEFSKKTNVNYLQVGISPKFNFGPAYAFVGPYFGYALSGTETGTWTVGDTEQTGAVDIFSDPAVWDMTKEYSDDNNKGGTGDLYNKVDFGLNLGFGANFSGVFVELSAGMGMLNFMNTESVYYNQAGFATADDKTVALTDEVSQKNIFFGLSVGYMLGGE